MQCAKVLRKRSLETELEPWTCLPKRPCLGAEHHTTEWPMETSHTLTVSIQQQEQLVGPVQPRAAPLCCPRCLGGEPGHINHIMGH